jgi:beta-glucosidase
MSSNIDDRTIRELYAWPFYDSLKAGVGSVMCSYQRINNSYSCQNSKLLNGILKTELGFEGFVVTDWLAQQAGVASANAGLDIVMPNSGYWGDNLTAAVNNGSVSLDRVDDMVTRFLAAHFYTGQDKGFSTNDHSNHNAQHPILDSIDQDESNPQGDASGYNSQYGNVDVRGQHARLIREIGAAGHVLVKNVNNTLPLLKPRFLGIYGYSAEVKSNPWDDPDRYGGGKKTRLMTLEDDS